MQQLARSDRIGDKAWPFFVLYDLNEIVEAFKKLLVDTNALYSKRDINDVFWQQSEDIKTCLVSMLHGQIFDVRYDGIADDFHFLAAGDDARIFVKTELDLGHAGTIRELRLNAWIPLDGGGKYGQCILRHERQSIILHTIERLPRRGIAKLSKPCAAADDL